MTSKQSCEFVNPHNVLSGEASGAFWGKPNRLIVQPELGDAIVVSGTGAGRWPTTESVMADLFEIRRRRSLDYAEESEELEACA